MSHYATSSLLSLLHSLIFRGPETIGDHIFVHAIEKVRRVFISIQITNAILIHVTSECLGGCAQVIVRDLSEEKMMHNMSICNMMAPIVNPKPKVSIHRLEGSIDIFPRLIVIHSGVGGMVLKVGHSD